MDHSDIENIYCIGRNYKKHALELGNEIPSEPVVFLKANSSLRGLDESDKLAFPQEVFHFEAEIVLLLGQDLSLGKKSDLSVLSGLALGVDLTRREKQTDLKKRGLPWTLSKSFQGSALLGTFYPLNHFPNPHEIEFSLHLDGKLKQKGNSKNMIFSLTEIINYINSFSALKKGDLIFTGTPEGVGEITKGQQIHLEFLNLNIIEKGTL